MLDSGNNWRTAISPQYAHKLGIDLIKDVNPIENMPVIGTAKKGTAMKVLGETKKFMHLKLSSCDAKFKIKFVIIDGLRCNMNIAGPFLHRHKIDRRQCRAVGFFRRGLRYV